jgi:uncharacterized OB-fold protein
MAQVAKYEVFMCVNAIGGDPRTLLGDVHPSSNQLFLASQEIGLYSYLAVYITSATFEQSTPAVVQIVDTTASVSGTAFLDLDLDINEIGGSVTWTAPGDVTHVTEYLTYLSSSIEGSSRLLVNMSAVGSNLMAIDVDTPKDASSYIVVYTKSSLFEQTTPDAVAIIDTDSSVTGVEFTDVDLDANELAGSITWSSPSSVSHVTSYSVYFTVSAAYVSGKWTGIGGRSQIGSGISVNALSTNVVSNTYKGSFEWVAVYTKSLLAEQTYPSAKSIIDTDASVSGIVFQDQDLDAAEISGPLSWEPPSSVSQVSYYVAYLASDASGTGSSPIETVSLGTNEISVPSDTPIGSHTHILVYTKSSNLEQTTPVALSLWRMPQQA